MHIRSFNPADSKGVRELISHVMEKEYPGEEKAYRYGDLEDMEKAYGGIREKFMVAEEDGKIIGTVGVKEDSGSVALLRRLFVHPSHRGRDIGSMLVDMALDFSNLNGYKTLVFRATSNMKAATGLLMDKKGFTEKERHVLDGVEIIILSRKVS